MSNDTLLAIPFFTFMGLVLERSGMAEDLLDTIGQLFGTIRGGLAYAVIFVGALLAALAQRTGGRVLNAPADLRGAAPRFPGLLVGGINEYGALLRADTGGVADEVRDAIAQTGGRRLMLGPGCVVPISVTDAAIEAAVRAAREGAPSGSASR